MPKTSKPKSLPPRGAKGRFLPQRGPKIISAPEYTPMRIGIDPIDWQRELKREVLPARKRAAVQKDRSLLFGWGVTLAAGIGGIGYLASRLEKPHR